MRLLSFVFVYALFVFVSSHFYSWKFPETRGTNWILKPHNPQQGQPPLQQKSYCTSSVAPVAQETVFLSPGNTVVCCKQGIPFHFLLPV